MFEPRKKPVNQFQLFDIPPARELPDIVECTQIHMVLHRPDIASVGMHEKQLKVVIAGNGCRAVYYKGYMFMEQNKNKDSVYAKMAREGKRITWAIPDVGSRWIYIDDENVKY